MGHLVDNCALLSKIKTLVSSSQILVHLKTCTFKRAVDRQLKIISAKTMSMSVGIGEEASLEHLVGRSLDSGDHMSGRKSDLLDLGKVVGRVAVEDHSTDWYEWVLAVRPHFSDVERVEFALLGLFDAHYLDVE